MNSLARIASLAAGAAVVAVGLVGAAGPTGADATAAVVESGWWTGRPAAAARGDGAVEVAQGLLAAESVAAFRVTTSAPVSSVALTLLEVDGLNQAGATILVCRTSEDWEGADAGALADAPEADCSVSAVLVRNAEGTAWAAELAPLLSGTTSSVVLVPAVADGALPTVFRVGLGGPVIAAAPLVPLAPPTTGVAGAPVPPAVVPRPTSPLPPAVSPRPNVLPTPRPAAPSTTIVTVPVTLPGQAAVFTPRVTISNRDDGGRPWRRLFLYLPVSVAAGAAALVVRRLVEARLTA